MFSRRTLLAALPWTAGLAPTLFSNSSSLAQDYPKYRVAVIGHTGRGNYGHGLDKVWLQVPNTELVAVADADAIGLAKAQKRLKVAQGFSDYRKMLDEVRPDLVAICPRHADQHCDMMLAAIAAGARGLYVEKPFCRTPAEADEVLSAAKREANGEGTKIAIAHRNRYHPTLQAIDRLIESGAIGRVLELRGRGKGDRRGGCEDLWVLGSHVLNLVHYFGGQPRRCSATLLQDGRPVTKGDVRPGGEGLGLLAGNQLHARYEMERGMVAYFDSVADDGTKSAGFGLQIVGSEGIVNIQCDRHPLAHLLRGNPFQPVTNPRAWIPITSAGPGEEEPLENLRSVVGGHIGPVQDLIAAVELDRQPICNASEGATTVEMICATFASHRQGGKGVSFPLEHRDNQLTSL